MGFKCIEKTSTKFIHSMKIDLKTFFYCIKSISRRMNKNWVKFSSFFLSRLNIIIQFNEVFCNVAWMSKLMGFVTFQFAHLSFLLLLFLLYGQYFATVRLFWVIIDLFLFIIFIFACRQWVDDSSRSHTSIAVRNYFANFFAQISAHLEQFGLISHCWTQYNWVNFLIVVP